MSRQMGSKTRGEREFPFPVIPKNGGLWFPFPNFGNGFFHSLPVPEFWEWIFFIPFPFPNFGNGIFSFPSHSRNLGMDFFIPFPFPNFGNGLFQFTNRRLAFQMLAWNIGGDIPNRLKDLFNLWGSNLRCRLCAASQQKFNSDSFQHCGYPRYFITKVWATSAFESALSGQDHWPRLNPLLGPVGGGRGGLSLSY